MYELIIRCARVLAMHGHVYDLHYKTNWTSLRLILFHNVYFWIIFIKQKTSFLTKSWNIAGKSRGTHHGLVCVGRVQLHVNLAVNPCFTFLVEVLARLTFGHCSRCLLCKSSKKDRMWKTSVTIPSVRSLTQQNRYYRMAHKALAAVYIEGVTSQWLSSTWLGWCHCGAKKARSIMYLTPDISIVWKLTWKMFHNFIEHEYDKLAINLLSTVQYFKCTQYV